MWQTWEWECIFMCIRIIENCLLPFCKYEQAKIFDGQRHRSVLKYYDPFWLRTTASSFFFVFLCT